MLNVSDLRTLCEQLRRFREAGVTLEQSLTGSWHLRFEQNGSGHSYIGGTPAEAVKCLIDKLEDR